MTEKLQITGLRITNFAGIKEFELRPEQLTILAGANGSGKTSVLDAVQSALARGGITDDDINVDADKAEVRVTMSDGLQVTRTRKRGGTQRVKVTREGAPVKGPQALLSELLDPVSLDPVAWLDGDRAKALLDSMPLSITATGVAAIYEQAGVPERYVPTTISVDGRHAVEVLADHDRYLTHKRKEKNADVKQLRSWLKSERAAQAEIEDPTDSIASLSSVIAMATQIKDDASRAEREHETAFAAESTARKNETTKQQQVDSLELQLQQARLELVELAEQRDAAAALTEEKLIAAKALVVDADGIEDQLRESNAAMDALREQRGAFNESLQQRGRIDAQADKLSELEVTAKQLDDGVRAIRAEPGHLLAGAELPVDGLEYIDGQLRRFGVPISKLSGAETIRLAAQVAVHRVKQQSGQFVLLDGLEQLDEEQRSALLDEVRVSGVQWLCTEVGTGAAQHNDGDLVVIMGAS